MLKLSGMLGVYRLCTYVVYGPCDIMDIQAVLYGSLIPKHLSIIHVDCTRSPVPQFMQCHFKGSQGCMWYQLLAAIYLSITLLLKTH